MSHSGFDPYQIPEISSWTKEDGTYISLRNFVSIHINAVEAIAFIGFIWPKFITIRGCTLILERYNAEVFEEWWVNLEGNVSYIERIINHTHIFSIFDEENKSDIIKEGLSDMTETLGKIWRCALYNSFPEKSFTVDISYELHEGPTITFFTSI